jgi:hypothetical protein
LNPLLKETIRRIVSIDSQFRDRKLHPYSTCYTFNLSEPIRDVVSMKLYSIQVPYTWYTISNTYGSNFFYIKGNSPGINNGNFDYKVSIPSGNYKSEDFYKAINDNITNILAPSYPDVIFGSTGVIYDKVGAKMSLVLDIQNIYNESNYKLEFFSPSTSTSTYTFEQNPETITSIPQLLGYNHLEYQPNIIYSSQMNDNKNKTYIVTDKNKTIYLIFYQGSETTKSVYNPSKAFIEKEIKITLSLSKGSHTADEIMTDLSNQLKKTVELNPLSSSITYEPYNNQHRYVLSINIDRYRITINKPYLKSVIRFEDDADVTPLWIGSTSCFKFKEYQELSNIVSENKNQITMYHISKNAKVLLTCTNKVYKKEGKYDVSMNVVDSNVSYRYTEYIYAIQNSMNALYKNTQYAFDLHINNDNPKHDASYDLNNSPIHRLQFKITNDLTQECQIKITFVGEIFKDILKIQNEPLSNSSTIHGSFDIQQSYTVDKEDKIIISSTSKVFDDVIIPLIEIQKVTYMSVSELFNGMNEFFDSISNTREVAPEECKEYNNIDMTQCFFKVDSISNEGKVDYKLVMDVSVILYEKDYSVTLSDQVEEPAAEDSALDSAPDSEVNSWQDYLGFKSVISKQLEYNSEIKCAQIESFKKVYNHEMILTNDNNSFKIVPIENSIGGVYTNDDSNAPNTIVITVDLPINQSYTKESIVSEINLQLSKNPLTCGSYIDITSKSRTQFYLTVNKIFTAKDYRIVFFDPLTFNRCNYGVPISVTSDQTLGWILGFRNENVYSMSAEEMEMTTGSPNQSNTTYYRGYPNQPYTYNGTTGIATLTGDTCINVNLYNYMLMILDDYTQNHLNDGLVTISTTNDDIPLPSYASRHYVCNQSKNTTYYIDNTEKEEVSNNQMTAKQIYAANQLLVNYKSKENTRSIGPSVQDVFGMIPVKTQGMQPGQSYIEFGGTLQNQDRLYFGPVNIRRLSVQLLNDKGTILDLNGADWSFSLMIEQLYSPKK